MEQLHDRLLLVSNYRLNTELYQKCSVKFTKRLWQITKNVNISYLFIISAHYTGDCYIFCP